MQLFVGASHPRQCRFVTLGFRDRLAAARLPKTNKRGMAAPFATHHQGSLRCSPSPVSARESCTGPRGAGD
jgi:hypothetical protein